MSVKRYLAYANFLTSSLESLQEEIVVILCELEMYFPPAFFDVMVHLLVHIMEDII